MGLYRNAAIVPLSVLLSGDGVMGSRFMIGLRSRNRDSKYLPSNMPRIETAYRHAGIFPSSHLLFCTTVSLGVNAVYDV